jgi:hypothetical protein
VSDFNIDQCLSGLPTAEQVKQKIDQIRREAAELRQQASAKMRQVPVLRNLIRAAELNAKATVPAKKRQRRKRVAADSMSVAPPSDGVNSELHDMFEASVGGEA